jgi:trans-AT polyketide synthase/acyltransferase/oxidoreductase domain-containing protein
VGEYNALLAAGVFDFLTGLKLVKRRGELMSQAKNGGMGAVIGLAATVIAEILKDNGLTSIDMANFNSESQTVVSGPLDDLKRAGPLFEKAGARMYVPLKVSAAFHSRYVAEAARSFADFLAPMAFTPPALTVIANVTAQPYPVQDASAATKALMVDQITSSVRWVQSIRYLMSQGVTEFKETGPGNVLTRLSQQIQQESTTDRLPLAPQKTESQMAENRKVEKNEAPTVTVIAAESLGNAEFKRDYNLRYAYLSGAMYKGIGSKEIVVAMGKAGMMGFLGTGGLGLAEIESAIQFIKAELSNRQPYGMNLLSNLERPQLEEQTVELYLKHDVRYVEAAAFIRMTASLVRWRLSGLKRNSDGTIDRPRRILAKVSRPEVATVFMQPAPESIVKELLATKKITAIEAELAQMIPMADEICVEADSGGHTDQGVAYALMPAMMILRDEMMAKYRYEKLIKVGAAGGIGTPHAAAAAFVMGADFILTGSINQCTVEAGTSSAVKDLLQELNVQDTDYAPAGDMFEIGARVQVVKRGLFFPARANKLYELYQRHASIEEIDAKTRQQIQERYFKRSFEEVWNETKSHYARNHPDRLANVDVNAKQKMALIFKWYFVHSTRLAMSGSDDQKVDYQIHCGPAMGAFNQWVRGTELHSWRNRRVAEIGAKLMEATAKTLSERFNAICAN